MPTPPDKIGSCLLPAFQNMVETKQLIDINAAHEILKKVVLKTPLQFHRKLSEKFGCEIYLKREDLQVVRSYKIRGAYNLFQSLNEQQRQRGIVCASAGNHAQGVAFSCKLLNIHGVIYMPAITPKQKRLHFAPTKLPLKRILKSQQKQHLPKNF